ncbi:AraC family transcriptional regulator [Sorangium cellulosum]|uniref:AraC family transcriptional regulator n=1 Tax=Sorangium cellulosum TaxID=56 RepID=UPI001F40E564|nr:AraC family transcriptional regulator [Sorangium cellulosum]
MLLVSAAPKLGLPIDVVLRDAALPPAALQQRGLPISLSAARQIWSAAERVSGDALLGLRTAETLDVGALDLLDYLTRNSTRFGEAVDRSIRFAPLLASAGVLSLKMVGRRAHFRHFSQDGVPAVSDLIAGLTVLRARTFSGEDIRPLAVRFRHRRERAAGEYERIFGAPVEFDAPFDELVFDRELLDVPFRSADPRLCELLEACAQARLEAVGRAGVAAAGASPGAAASPGFLDEVRQALRICIADGNPNLDRVAEHLGMSARTVQRQLREQGMSHRALLTEVRAEIASRYLASQNPTHRALASRLGYASPRSVSRALRRQ